MLPTFSRFYGIVVFMHYNEHEPPHFHARYQNQEITMEIGGGRVTGTMARRALRLLFEWVDLHQDELRENWELARARRPLQAIAPLL